MIAAAVTAVIQRDLKPIIDAGRHEWSGITEGSPVNLFVTKAGVAT
jgi:hypothetical protein